MHRLLAPLALAATLACPPLVAQGAPKDFRGLESLARSATSAEARIDALEALAALPPTEELSLERITRALAQGLEDDQASVRARTAELLAPGLHPEVAVRSLTRALADESRAWKGAVGDILDHSRVGQKWAERQEDREFDDATQRYIDEHNAKLATIRARIDAHAMVVDATATRLGSWPDSRSEGALVVALKTTSSKSMLDGLACSMAAERALPLVDALLALGGRSGLDTIAGTLSDWGAAHDDSGDELRALEKERGGENRDGEEATLRSRLARQEEHLRNLTQRLREFAEARSLPAAPGSAPPVRPWRSWATKVRASLPKSLGRVAAPPD